MRRRAALRDATCPAPPRRSCARSRSRTPARRATRAGRPDRRLVGARRSSATSSAACELAEQVRAGALPEPAAIFVAGGQRRHASPGWSLGLALAGLRTRGRRRARDGHPAALAAQRLARLARATLRGAAARAPRLPEIAIRAARLRRSCASQLGPGYGAATDAARAAAPRRPRAASRSRRPTPRRCLAAAARRGRARRGLRGPVLFWNTYNCGRRGRAGRRRRWIRAACRRRCTVSSCARPSIESAARRCTVGRLRMRADRPAAGSARAARAGRHAPRLPAARRHAAAFTALAQLRALPASALACAAAAPSERFFDDARDRDPDAARSQRIVETGARGVPRVRDTRAVATDRRGSAAGSTRPSRAAAARAAPRSSGARCSSICGCARFSALDDAEQDASLRGWMTSAPRAAPHGLPGVQELSLLGCYSQDATLAADRLPGPAAAPHAAATVPA